MTELLKEPDESSADYDPDGSSTDSQDEEKKMMKKESKKTKQQPMLNPFTGDKMP